MQLGLDPQYPAVRLGQGGRQLAGVHQRAPGLPALRLRTRCRPSPCGRLSRPRTTTAAPPRPGATSGRRTCPPPTWPARGAGGVRAVPTFAARSIDGRGVRLCPCGLATPTPQTFGAASRPATLTGPGVTRHPGGLPGVHRDPAHIRQVGAGGILERRSTPVPHVHRPVLLAGPRPSGSAGPPRRCRGCLPPSPASPGSGCPQLQPPCCDKAAAKVSHLHSIPQRLVALHVPIPAIPATNLVVVQADLALGLLEAFLDRPSCPRHPDQLGQAGTGRAEQA